MTGMKEGAGGDPFADDEADSESTPPLEETSSRSSAENASDDESTAPSEENPTRERTDQETEMQQPRRSTETRVAQIPYKFRRNGVQDGRNRVPLFLQDETKRDERETLRELENRFDEDVTLTDLREAVVKVGFQHSDEIAAQLMEWGYGMTFDDS